MSIAEPLTFDRHFIGGEWVPARSGRTIDCVDPANGEIWALVPEGGADDVDDAVAAAKHAFRHPSWTKLSATGRGALLVRIADLIAENAGRLSELETRDSGMTLRDAQGMVAGAETWFRYYAGMADKVLGTTVPAHPDWHAYTTREPLGVVAAILPWNAPLLMFSWKVAPALATGNAIVVKSAEQTPVTALEMGKLIERAGAPPGIVNILTGFGEIAGDRLSRHPDVAKIAFTGEHRTAAKIASAAANSLKKLSFECGGKAPHIVFPDADLDRAADSVANSAFRFTGQSCALGSRIFLHRAIHDEFLERIVERARQTRAGDPFDPASDIGPQAHEQQLHKTLSYMKVGTDEGARVVHGGHRITDQGLERGFFVAPTVLAGVNNRMRVAQEEIFGPVASVISFDDEEELTAAANDVIYGLTAGMWTRDIGRAHRLARRLEAGSVWINVYPAVHYMMPYGGVKLSGYGRENGEAAIAEYTTTKSVVVGLAE